MLCQWESTLPNYGEEVDCGDGEPFPVGYETIDECIDSYDFPPDCAVSVADTEVCVRALYENVCAEEFPAACDALDACFGDPGDGPMFDCGGGESVPEEWVCDGEADCENGSDEQQNCPAPFMCANGEQIPADWQCDGEDDCGDNSDEQNCGG
jgi:hypothetical protein